MTNNHNLYLTFKKSLVISCLSLTGIVISTQKTSAQDVVEKTIRGRVYDKKNHESIPGTQVIALPSMKGTITDMKGNFELTVAKGDDKIAFNSMAFAPDTLAVGNEDMEVHLEEKHKLNEVVVSHRVKSTELDMLSPKKTEKIGAKELMKAACCNLSESFETTPSVDVGFTDAVSGYKQIQMLGLAGTHTSFTRENIPDVRGLAAITGLTFTPGTFVNSMQLSKGAGSVVNGFEGTAGQINIEWIKPFEKDEPKLILNGYQSIQGRSEGNAVYNHDFKNGLSTNLLLHGRSDWGKVDDNNDGFLDQPLGEVFVGANRWFYFTETGWEIQAGVKGVYANHTGGQLSSLLNEQNNQSIWSYNQKIQRLEGWAKIGKVFLEKPWKSMGLQLSGLTHNQESTYGNRTYDGKQQSLYANYIFQSIIGNTNHIIKGGASFMYDHYDEKFLGNPFKRSENVAGIFTEYAYNYLTKFNIVAGLRADYHNQFGAFITPRLHMRYAPTEKSVFRASAGRAQRTANVFAENTSYLASNRSFLLEGYNNGTYDYKPEIAWNMGLNFTQHFLLNYRDGSFSMDYYYTDFQNQIVVDIENPHEVSIYNLQGKSFAHSFQAQLDYEPIRRFDVRLAYRYYNVKTDYKSGLKEKPLTAAHRAFMNLGYETNNNWKLDYTLNWTGSKRIPAHFLNDNAISESYSPSFFLMNAQLSKSWKKSKFEIYGGVENILNTIQPNLILDAQNPFGNNFDAALIWGSGMGRNLYVGFRVKI